MNCSGCNKSLMGQRFIKQQDKSYCMHCFDTKIANKCCKCGKMIGVESRDLVHEGNHWHAECFTCIDCGRSLADRPFVRKGGALACANCKEEESGPVKCSGCDKTFGQGAKRFNYKGKQFHPECFKCIICEKPIGQQSFIPRDNGYVCTPCYDNKLADVCASCHKPISGEGVTYKDQGYHPECFVCGGCGKKLGGEKFTHQDGVPFCQVCYEDQFAKRCSGCNGAISAFGGEQFVTFEDNQWHQGCFKCTRCSTGLAGKGFVKKEGQILCGAC